MCAHFEGYITYFLVHQISIMERHAEMKAENIQLVHESLPCSQ